MKKLLLALALILAPPAWAAPLSSGFVVTTCGTLPSPPGPYLAGREAEPAIDLAGNMCIGGTISLTPSGTQDVNVKQIAGTTTAVGAGATDGGTQRFTIANDSPGIIALGTAGVPATGVLTIQGIASMTKLLVTPDANAAVNAQPTPVTSGGLLTYLVEAAANDNHANIVNGAHQVYHIAITNKSGAVQYLRLYNAGTGFNGCGSATNIQREIQIPFQTSSNIGGFVEDFSMGLAFGTGISICYTGNFGQTDTTNATASASAINIDYK